MLSRPPASLAAAISARPPASSEPLAIGQQRLELRPRGPSTSGRREQSRKTSPARAGKASTSTSTSGSGPSARVMTERCGCSSACSSVSLPRRDELARRASGRASGARGRRRAAGSSASRRRARRRPSSLADVGGGERRAHAGALRVGCATARGCARWPPGSARRAPSAGSPPSGSPPSNCSTAISEATSPACAPPIPSATTNSGARTKKLSSLPWRWRPRSESWKCSAIAQHRRQRSKVNSVSPMRIAVARVQRLRPAQRLVVEVGAVRRAEVLEHDRRPRAARGARGGRRRTSPRARISAWSPRPSSAPSREVVRRAGAAARRRCSTRSCGVAARRAPSRAPAGACRSRRRSRGPARRPVVGAAAQVLQRAARHPQQEQVEDGEEAELQGDGDGIEHGGGLLQLEGRARGAELDHVARLSDCGPLDRGGR